MNIQSRLLLYKYWINKTHLSNNTLLYFEVSQSKNVYTHSKIKNLLVFFLRNTYETHIYKKYCKFVSLNNIWIIQNRFFMKKSHSFVLVFTSLIGFHIYYTSYVRLSWTCACKTFYSVDMWSLRLPNVVENGLIDSSLLEKCDHKCRI